MKVFLAAPKENWFPDNFKNEFQHYNSDIIVDNPNDADILWLMVPYVWNHFSTEFLNKKKVICTIHHLVPEKFDYEKRQEFFIRDAYVDYYHVPNKYTYQMIGLLTDRPIKIIEYWYDPKKWFFLDKIDCRKELNLPLNKFIVGSFQRDGEGKDDGLTPKLEKGPDLFCNFISDILYNNEELKNNIHVLLGGYRRKFIVNNLESQNISYSYMEMSNYNILNKMYNSLDLYLTLSRIEGGNQSILESSATKTPIISTNVGIADVVLSRNCILTLLHKNSLNNKSSTLENFVYSKNDFKELPSQQDIDTNYNNVLKFNIENHSNVYRKFFEQI